MTVGGVVADGFEPVRDAFAEVAAGQGGGACVAAYVGGRVVVDLWGGTVGRDTLVHTWSAIKPVTGACLLLLVERGQVSLDDPVRTLWPELRAGADGRLLVRHVLSHAAGLASVPPPGTLAGLVDWDATCAGLAAAEPDWEPGTAVGEHALTYGHLVGELVRRIDGRTLGRFLAEEVTGPLGLDVHVGLGDADLGRVADTVVPAGWGYAQRAETGLLPARAIHVGIDEDVVNGEAWRRAEVPAVNGHATARGLAGFWQAHLDGRLPAGLDVREAEGDDVVLGSRVVWTLGGGRLDGPDVGMGGLGGQWAAARPSVGLAWAFLTNRVGDHDRAQRVEDALAAVLAG